MFVSVLAAETDETRQAITTLIVGLVLIAVLLGLLTAWYWFYTSPKRRAEAQPEELNVEPLLANDMDESVGAVGPVAPRGDESRQNEPVGPIGRAADGDPEPALDSVALPGVAAAADPVVVPLTLLRVEGEVGEQDRPVNGDQSSDLPVVGAGRITVERRSDVDSTDELAKVRRRRSAGGPRPDDEGQLSDDMWAAAISSAFDHYRR